MTVSAGVHLWGRRIGAVSLLEGRDHAVFQYEPAFVRSGIQVAPLTMPLSERGVGLPRAAAGGLPRTAGPPRRLAPDRFGHAVIDAWLARQGREPASFSAVDRLCHIGRRGTGALTFEPATGPRLAGARRSRWPGWWSWRRRSWPSGPPCAGTWQAMATARASRRSCAWGRRPGAPGPRPSSAGTPTRARSAPASSICRRASRTGCSSSMASLRTATRSSPIPRATARWCTRTTGWRARRGSR